MAVLTSGWLVLVNIMRIDILEVLVIISLQKGASAQTFYAYLAMVSQVIPTLSDIPVSEDGEDSNG